MNGIQGQPGGDELDANSGGKIDVKSGAEIDVDSGATLKVNGNDVTAELAALDGNTATAAELSTLHGVTAGTTSASKALVVDANKALDTLDVATPKANAVTLSKLKWVDVAVTAALLDGAGSATVMAAAAGRQYKIRNIILVGGGTNFGAGGDRNISLTDGTTTWTTVAAADAKAAPSASLMWGNSKVNFLTGTSNTSSVANTAIVFKYSGGTTDYSGVGSITFSVLVEQVA